VIVATVFILCSMFWTKIAKTFGFRFKFHFPSCVAEHDENERVN